MKAYKICTAKSPERAEYLMNEMARDGWSVKTVTPWDTAMTYQLVITFEREAQ